VAAIVAVVVAVAVVVVAIIVIVAVVVVAIVVIVAVVVAAAAAIDYLQQFVLSLLSLRLRHFMSLLQKIHEKRTHNVDGIFVHV